MSSKKFRLIGTGLAVFLSAVVSISRAQDTKLQDTLQASSESPEHASAILAGGCFWCVESDFEKLPGVVNLVSGYTGGRTKDPTYKNYSSGGHREAVFIVYDPQEITYAGLVEYLVKHIDPTDRQGQFKDRGVQYSPAAYYANQEEKDAADRVLKAIDKMKVYRGKVAIAIKPRVPFWPAEEYHQDYHHKNTFKYNFYRLSSGRDAFVNKHWGARAAVLALPGAYPEGKGPRAGETAMNDDSVKEVQPWKRFVKPTGTELRRRLSAIQYKVTQQDGTELAHRNAYWDNKREGIYVDVVSGAPLFSSHDKFKSDTGWPSFVAPIAPDALTFRVDRKLFSTRTEVRSQYGDSHLGHVFNDGPPARGGKRYCMNSAAMRFVPKEKLESEGLGEFLPLFKK